MRGNGEGEIETQICRDERVRKPERDTEGGRKTPRDRHGVQERQRTQK